jgi:XTP/dITP diphosphohydrolase
MEHPYDIQLVVATRNRHKVHEIQEMLVPGFHCIQLSDFADTPGVDEDADSFVGNATKKSRILARWLAENGDAGHALARQGPVYVLADDSGLEVDALGGAPGVHSARFAALDSCQPGNSPDAQNNAKLLRLLQNVPLDRRTARFRCAIAMTSVHEWIDSIGSGSTDGCALDSGNNGVGVSTVQESEGRMSGSRDTGSGSQNTLIFEGVCKGRILFEPRGRAGFGYDPLFVPEGFLESFAELGEEVKNGISHRARALAALKEHFQNPRL